MLDQVIGASDNKERPFLQEARTFEKMAYIEKMTDWYIMPFSKLFHLYRSGQYTYLCFSGVLLTSTPHNVLSKPPTAFPFNHRRNNGQHKERNDYNQS